MYARANGQHITVGDLGTRRCDERAGPCVLVGRLANSSSATAVRYILKAFGCRHPAQSPGGWLTATYGVAGAG